MDNENEFELGGKIYESEDAKYHCSGCEIFNCSSDLDERMPPCHRMDRKDGRQVIFVEKHP